MINLYFYLIFTLFIFFLLFFFNRMNLLKNTTGLNHQVFYNYNKKPIPLIGGIFFLIFIFFFNEQFSNSVLIFFTFFFLLGFISDTKFEPNPKFRFLIQFVLSIFFVFLCDLNINDVRISFLNLILNNYFISILFTAFCITVLLNGSNFIDGNNTLLIGYYLIINLVILFFNNHLLVDLEIFFFSNMAIFLIILFTFNFFEKFYMGDSGSYLLSVVAGFFLIKIYKNHPSLSPYYIVNLLWYPAFENLFSIIRKLYSGNSPLKPDNKHLHQLLYIYLLSKLNLKNKLVNSITSNLINFYNFFILLVVSNFIFETKTQVSFLFLNIFLYIFFYMLLKKMNGRIVQR